MNNKIIERVVIFILTVASIGAVIIFSLYFVMIAKAMNKEQGAEIEPYNPPPKEFRSDNLVSASEDVTVSATVLPNLSLSIADNKPDFATNSSKGLNFSATSSKKSVIHWTVSANF